ncbi:fibrous sheath-interacting protein 2-like isoform X3 [Mastomys coucha]|uniref:fibrous sheath-interacting protein 2-like isoform X3 n=1 Tax=Mastomys coucha TaxID=35658 RepID=UPI0012619F3A|nr:fibrous sheath-interacting protein 2-like isoform X3 [Mastomys coucha]
MDLYLSNCLKAAEAAAAKAASGNLPNDKSTCNNKKQKPIIPKIGAANLLDLPLGAKLPVIPGSTNIFYTTNISEKLYQPSFGFNLSDPYCKLMETTYKSLHDPHLKSYFRRKDILKKLRKGGYITNNNKVVCTLKELNKYRQYLTTLKIDFERNYVREQKIIENQVRQLNEERQACDNAAAAEFQRWLLQEGKKPSPHHDRLIKLRHLNMINKELDKIEDTLGRRSTIQMKEVDRQHWDDVRRRLNLHQEVEQEWQSKEMSLLTKIGEEVGRETKVEEHRRKIREEINRKKQVMLQKRIAYHLQKLQKKDSKDEKQESSVSESKRQSETASTTQKQPSFSEPKMPQEQPEQKSSISSIQTSVSERLMQESRESKSASQMTRTSFEEDRSSLYEFLDTRFSPADTRRSSFAEEHAYQDVLGQKHYHHSSGKKTSFADDTLFHEHSEQKYGPSATKRTSFADKKFMEDLLEAKYLYQNTKRTSFADQKLMEDNLEPILTSPNARTSLSDQGLFYEPIKPKSPPIIKKTSFAEEKSFQQLMEAIRPPQYIKKTSFTDQKPSQESLESRRSSHHSQNNTKVFVKTSTTSLPQQRDMQETTDIECNKGTAGASFHSHDRGMKRISNPVLSHSQQSTVLSRQSYPNIPTQEVDPSFRRNTYKHSK